MTPVSAWVGAGVFTAGISAAVLLGAGTANATEAGGPKPDPSRATSKVDATKRPQHAGPHSAEQRVRPETAGGANARKMVLTKQREVPATASGHLVDSVAAATGSAQVSIPAVQDAAPAP